MTPEEQEKQLTLAKQAIRNATRDQLGYAELTIEALAEWVVAEAARIVEQRLASLEFQSMDIGGKWVDHSTVRVKPKAE